MVAKNTKTAPKNILTTKDYAESTGTAPWTIGGEFPTLDSLKVEDCDVFPNPSKVAKTLKAKTKIREDAIRALQHRNKRSGQGEDRILAAITYDSEIAPLTTNRKQLEDIGIFVPSLAEVDTMPDATVSCVLRIIVCNMASLGIFFCGTDHLTDRAMLLLLCEKVLIEEIRDIPPTPDMTEFIDLTPCKGDRDPILRKLPAPYRPSPLETSTR
jgi:hypothetical protein